MIAHSQESFFLDFGPTENAGKGWEWVSVREKIGHTSPRLVFYLHLQHAPTINNASHATAVQQAIRVAYITDDKDKKNCRYIERKMASLSSIDLPPLWGKKKSPPASPTSYYQQDQSAGSSSSASYHTSSFDAEPVHQQSSSGGWRQYLGWGSSANSASTPSSSSSKREEERRPIRGLAGQDRTYT